MATLKMTSWNSKIILDYSFFNSIIGNEAIKKGNPQEALQMYDEALKCDPLNKTINSILYSNRALGTELKINYLKLFH